MNKLKKLLLVGLMMFSIQAIAGEKAIVAVSGYPINSIVITWDNGTSKTIEFDAISKKSETVNNVNMKILEVINNLEENGFKLKGQIGQIGAACTQYLFVKE